ncbi:hypothetical protein [Lysobacter gummosus]|uniref:hypothetical protein n=1 Tax=Lysobacter gummosus TaxID=262324 RepID=UPI00362FFF69
MTELLLRVERRSLALPMLAVGQARSPRPRPMPRRGLRYESGRRRAARVAAGADKSVAWRVVRPHAGGFEFRALGRNLAGVRRVVRVAGSAIVFADVVQRSAAPARLRIAGVTAT